jgi:hypothetical protein
MTKLKAAWATSVVGAAIIAFGAGRWTAPVHLLGGSVPSDQRLATYAGGALSVAEAATALAGIASTEHRRAAVEQFVRARLLAHDAEAACLHRTPEFLARYAEELARVELEEVFEKPFRKQLPRDDEVQVLRREREQVAELRSLYRLSASSPSIAAAVARKPPGAGRTHSPVRYTAPPERRSPGPSRSSPACRQTSTWAATPACAPRSAASRRANAGASARAVRAAAAAAGSTAVASRASPDRTSSS